MNSEAIYAILASKPHDVKYLDLYFRYIKRCSRENSKKTKEALGYTEGHHICPKAKDLFPEYVSFKEFPWNKAVLTSKQHMFSHFCLFKCFGGSQAVAYTFMVNTHQHSAAEYLRFLGKHNLHHSQTPHAREAMSNRQLTLIKNNKHRWKSPEYAEEQRVLQKALCDAGVHPLLTDEAKDKSRDVTRRQLGRPLVAKLLEFQLTYYIKLPSWWQKLSDVNLELLWSAVIDDQNKTPRNLKIDEYPKRANVATLRELGVLKGVKLGKGWTRRANSWIDNKIIELQIMPDHVYVKRMSNTELANRRSVQDIRKLIEHPYDIFGPAWYLKSDEWVATALDSLMSRDL